GKVAFATSAEGERDAFFEVEKQVAKAVVGSLGVPVSAKERGGLARIHTLDFEAFRRFSDGVRLFDDAEYDRALEALRQAAGKDAEVKLARTTLETYERLAAEVRSQANVREAEEAAAAALARKQAGGLRQAVIDRLAALAAQKSAPRARRVAALYFVVQALMDSEAEVTDE